MMSKEKVIIDGWWGDLNIEQGYGGIERDNGLIDGPFPICIPAPHIIDWSLNGGTGLVIRSIGRGLHIVPVGGTGPHAGGTETV